MDAPACPRVPLRRARPANHGRDGGRSVTGGRQRHAQDGIRYEDPGTPVATTGDGVTIRAS
jgi:hypothetical protein